MFSKFSHLPDISTTQPDRLIKYRVSEDRFTAEVLLPGLSYTDFDQKIGGNSSSVSFVTSAEHHLTCKACILSHSKVNQSFNLLT